MAEDQTMGVSLQKEVDRILKYLSQLSNHFDLYEHRPTELRDVSVQTYYTMIARKVQNKSFAGLTRGFETGDPESFLDGMKNYQEAAKILNLGIENPEEVSAFYQEMINLFLKFIKNSSDGVGRFEPKGSFFKLQSLIAVARVLEDVMRDYVKAAGYRNQAMVIQKRWKKLLEVIYIIFDLVISGNFEAAEPFLEVFSTEETREEILQLAIDGDTKAEEELLESLDAFKALGAVIIAAAEKGTRESIDIIIDKINELSSKGIPITLVSLQRFTQKLAQLFGFNDVVEFKTNNKVSLEKLKPPMPPTAATPSTPEVQPPISAEMAESIQASMGNEMQKVMHQVETAQQTQMAGIPGATVDLNNTTMDSIKNAISEGMKGLASEIVSQITSKMGSFGGGGGGYARGGGRGPMANLDGDGVPQVKSMGRAKPSERPARPKLSDMLDSVIVDE
ncbi:MAG: hypothetical protein ACFFCS_04585 [Candidatus Hodarchaeota archaeon]